jgi:hypothetical protein
MIVLVRRAAIEAVGAFDVRWRGVSAGAGGPGTARQARYVVGVSLGVGTAVPRDGSARRDAPSTAAHPLGARAGSAGRRAP